MAHQGTSKDKNPAPEAGGSVSQVKTPPRRPLPPPPADPEPDPETEGEGGGLEGEPPSNESSPHPPPPPPLPAVEPAVPTKHKSHVKKPEDFVDAKQWDRFKRQTYIYIQENAKDFSDDQQVIHFLLSFMTGGLPEKFAANFIDDLTEDHENQKQRARALRRPQPEVDWGTTEAFFESCDEVFSDQNKKPNAEHQLDLLRQGSKSAEEYFQEFDQLVRTADTRGTTRMS